MTCGRRSYTASFDSFKGKEAALAVLRVKLRNKTVETKALNKPHS